MNYKTYVISAFLSVAVQGTYENEGNNIFNQLNGDKLQNETLNKVLF